MMRTSFRNKLLLLMVAVLALTLLTTVLAVLRATTVSVESLVRSELQVAGRVFQSLLMNEQDQLRLRSELLADDFAFRRAVATGDRATLVSALANHGERIDADLVLLLSAEREVLLSTHDVDGLPDALAALGAPSTDESVEMTVLAQGEPFQLVLVPVMAPDLLGWVGLGMAIDRALLTRLREIAEADITLVYGGAGDVLEVSTLPASTLPSGGADNVETLVSSRIAELRRDNWLSEQVSLLDSPRGDLRAVLSASLDQALQSYQPLRLQMIMIAFAALALAAITALLVARWITRPIYRLMAAASQIADGDYTKPVRLEGDSEFERLAEAFNLMRDTVAEREARIRHQAQHDMLTELPNRNYIYSLFESHIRESPAGHRFGLGLLELTELGQLTDLYGSDFSDEVLKQVATRISEHLRRGDMAARVADRDILLFYDDLDHEGVDKVAAKLQEDLPDSLEVSGVPVRLRWAAGFVLCPQHGHDFDDVLRRAQIALKRAQSAGLGHATYRVGEDETHLRQIRVANRLQTAVRERQFSLVFQPKYNLRTRRVDQVEVLMRWTDAELGQVFPDEFIPLAEQTGIITQISVLVLELALAQLQRWRAEGFELAICVNLSGMDILKADFVEGAIAELRDSGLDAGGLVLEITETAMVADLAVATENIARFREEGIGLAIDDFGTGFSSLAQLKALPVQELKIDKSLVQNLDRDPDDQLIVRSTIEMAHYLGLSVVAEGVENLASLQMLHAMGCDAVQGYYLARPMSAELLGRWLAAPPAEVRAIAEWLNASG